MQYSIDFKRTLSENIDLFLLLNRMPISEFLYLSTLSNSTLYQLRKTKPSAKTYDKLAKTMNLSKQDLEKLAIRIGK